MFCKNHKSFGLLEVVITVAIFLLTIGAIISITGLGSKNLMRNEARWKATILVENYIDERKIIRDNIVLDWVSHNPGTPFPTANPDRWHNTTIGGVAYNLDPNPANPCRQNRFYDFNMNQGGSAATAFFTLTCQCFIYPYPPPPNSMFFDVGVSWNQFGQANSVNYRVFLKDISGSVN